jgi:hexosaminidase
MELHKGARFLHVGCDEVFQMGECRRCRSQMRETLFLSHVARVATFVRSRYSALTPIIWDDMLRHLSPQSLEEFHIGELVEPMVRSFRCMGFHVLVMGSFLSWSSALEVEGSA